MPNNGPDPDPPRARPRVPSGPRPFHVPSSFSRVTSSSSIPKLSTTYDPSIRAQPSLGSLSKLEYTDSPLDGLLDGLQDLTESPEGSPRAANSTNGSPSQTPLGRSRTPVHNDRSRTEAVAAAADRGVSSARPQIAPAARAGTQSSSSSSSMISQPSSSISSPPTKPKPKPSRLNTVDLVLPPTSSPPSKPISPGLKHWQQVRSHVLAPTPTDERTNQHSGRTGGKKLGIVSKAAGRFGFRQAAEHVIDGKRTSTLTSDLGELSFEEKEEIARERRKFARDIKACLDACALEESCRRLRRIGESQAQSLNDQKSSAASVHGSSYTAQTAQRITFDPDFSAFAPLLTELHRHLPSARSKKLWSRTVPHHSAILAELGVAFLPDSASTEGERQQALELFGAVVKNWASDTAEEELSRWIWLCRALLIDDRQLRHRGLTLLVSFLHTDPLLPRSPDRPHSAFGFQRLVGAIFELLHAVENSSYGSDDHLVTVNGFLSDLVEGDIIDIDQDSLVDLIMPLEISVSQTSLARELLWMTVGKIIGTNTALASWLLASGSGKLQRFLPPPLLHATPPVILQLRALGSSYFLASFCLLISANTGPHVVSLIWKTAEDRILADVRNLPSDGTSLSFLVGELLLEMEMRNHRTVRTQGTESLDPFEDNSTKPGLVTCHRETLFRFLGESRWNKGIQEAAKQVVSLDNRLISDSQVMTHPLQAVAQMLQSFLQKKTLASLGREALSPFWTRLASMTSPPLEVKNFVLWLSTHNPQLFYKPLFSLSAATQPATLASNLHLVTLQSQLVGASRFWTHADPQMLIIVLMGDISPKQGKGKTNEGELSLANVKIGRYAVLLELIKAFDDIDDEDARTGSRLRGFVEAIESGLSAMLAAEEKVGRLSSLYRGLICQLFLKMRVLTQAPRRAPWMNIVISWFTDMVSPSSETEDQPATMLSSVYHNFRQVNGAKDVALSSSPSAKVNGGRPPIMLLGQRRQLLDETLSDAAASLLVATHSGLSSEDWTVVLPRIWLLSGEHGIRTKAVTFLVNKCGEVIPAQLTDLIMKDVLSLKPLLRSHALGRLAVFYGWRHQVLAQQILTDRRGPVFHFPLRTLAFVATDIGSPLWTPPPDVQDAALQKFGPSLPLELRQRLMELGWSNDDSLASKSDWEQIPFSKMPILLYQQDPAGMRSEKSPIAVRPLIRRASTGSVKSLSLKRRKAIFAPILMAAINEQASLMVGEVDSSIYATSRDLVRIVQRDDPTAFLRAFTDVLAHDFAGSLARLNAVISSTTPGFAHAALNALAGYLRTILRVDSPFAQYSQTLATISTLIPQISEMSLRDIRKNKAEAVLLPASIHGDEGGFKLHTPWRENLIPVQTAQLLIITEIFKANPREVYLIKKMLSNLQIQLSIQSLSFSRAWLLLVATVFAGVNHNYNDRAELRHFLYNIAAIFRAHGSRDILVTVHAMRVFTLCSARFRRLFASMGFNTVMPAVCETYKDGSPAIRDCIEFAVRSFYRIHQDTFVYQTCVVIAEANYDPAPAYDLLASLSSVNSASSGVPSGLRGLNDKEEVDALVRMISGPEIALSDIGIAAAERQAQKLASVSLDENVFPRENIIRLFVTVIATNPSSDRARSFLHLFAGIVPCIKDANSQQLLREAVEALGAVVIQGRTGDEAAILTFRGADGSKPNWDAVRREYVHVVESYARSGGALGPEGTRRTLEIVLDLLRRQPEAVGPAASSILSELAKTHLSGSEPVIFLNDIAPIFSTFIAVVDFSGVLEQITSLIHRSSFDLDPQATRIIVEAYVEPAMRMLAKASENNMASVMTMRPSAVNLLSAAIFLRGDALGALERHSPSAGLLAAVVLPLTLSLEKPSKLDNEAMFSSIWIRLLHYVLQPHRRFTLRPSSNVSPQAVAASAVLSLQIVKIIVTRAPDSLTNVKGLWNYVAQYLLGTIADGDGRFVEIDALGQPSPRVVDWMMWSLFELLSLHRSPLQIDLRYRMQTVLAAIRRDSIRSRPSTPGERPKTSSSPHLSGRVRNPSARSPSIALHPRMPGNSSPARSSHSRMLSSPNAQFTPEHGGHSRMPSQNLSPLLPGHARMASWGSTRPSFADLSARRASRPVFEAFPGSAGMAFRFPSSTPVRSAGGGAIVHLLGAPSQAFPAVSSPNLTIPLVSAGGVRQTIKELRLTSEALREGARRAVRVCQFVFGYELDLGEVEEHVRVWSVHDALHVISEQTKIFVEQEFKDVFHPVYNKSVDFGGEGGVDPEKEAQESMQYEETKEEGEWDLRLPVLAISSP